MSHDEISKLNPLEKAVEKALAERLGAPPPLRQAAAEQRTHVAPQKKPVLAEVAPDGSRYTELDLDVLDQNQIVGHLKSGIGTNVFNLLRSQILVKMRRNGCRTLAITGPTEGVGKSLVSMNLSLAIAKQKQLQVTLLDLDLRKPSIARLLDIQPDVGIVDYLEGKQHLSDVAIRTQLENVRFVAGNSTRQNASELLSSDYARKLLPTLAPTDGHFVAVDLPPILGLSDVHTFLPECDAVLLVVEYARTTAEQIEETIRLLGDVPLVGTVVNKGHLSSLDVYGYGYNGEKS